MITKLLYIGCAGTTTTTITTANTTTTAAAVNNNNNNFPGNTILCSVKFAEIFVCLLLLNKFINFE
jgi:hypothetical protein